MWFLCLNIIAELLYIRAVRRDFDPDTRLQAVVCEAGAIFGVRKSVQVRMSILRWRAFQKVPFHFGDGLVSNPSLLGLGRCFLLFRLCSWVKVAFLQTTSSQSDDFWVVRELRCLHLLCWPVPFQDGAGLLLWMWTSLTEMGWGAWQGRILYFFLPELVESLSNIYRAVDSIPWRLLFNVFRWLVMSTKKWNLSTQG